MRQKVIEMTNPTDALTKRQKAVYEFIRDKIRNRGYGPTVREIGDHFEIRSPNGVMCHLKAIEKKGLISREKNMSRAIHLSQEPIEEKGLPLYGMIAAGVLHEAVEQDERVDFGEMFWLIESSGFKGHYMNGFGSLEAMLEGREYLLERAVE